MYAPTPSRRNGIEKRIITEHNHNELLLQMVTLIKELMKDKTKNITVIIFFLRSCLKNSFQFIIKFCILYLRTR